MKKLSYIIILLFALACKRDELYYEASDMITLAVAVDWSDTDISPNGVTALVYTASGDLYKVYPPFNVTDTLRFTLPEGEYDIILFNDSDDEHEYLEFSNIDHIDSLSVSTVELTTRSSDAIIVANPDFLATSRLNGVSVSSVDKDYYTQDDYANVNTTEKNYSTTMTRRVYNYSVTVEVDGLNYAASYPDIVFEHLSGGYNIGQEKVDGSLVKHSFSLETLTYDDDTKTSGSITATFSNFGLLDASDVDYLMDVSFTLTDGSTFSETFDVTDQIAEENVSRSVTTVDKQISVSTTLPTVIGGDGSGSSFDTSVDQWQEVVQSLPI